MTLTRFRAQDFRCLEAVDFEPGPGFNLIYGANASGKTSLLEAVAYLGRGKSFRGATTSALIRHGQRALVLTGRVRRDGRESALGVRNSADGLEIRVDGDAGGGAAALAEALPLQVIDPAVHDLVGGSPEGRRRFLDWVVFHVKPDYLATWRQFRRALKQRNAILRRGTPSALGAWNAEFAALGEALDESRAAVFEAVGPAMVRLAGTLLGAEPKFEYRRGWADNERLEAALAVAEGQDLKLGSTQHGPHRADIRLRVDDRIAKQLVSRGQQKLLASAMILGATETVAEALGRELLLLVDDPAAELDRGSVGRLIETIGRSGAQVLMSSLERDALPRPDATRVFHVEHGRLSAES